MAPEEKDPAFLWDMREAEFPAAETVRFAVERLVLVSR